MENATLKVFTDYCIEFYGDRFTHKAIEAACLLFSELTQNEFLGDSFDRERVFYILDTFPTYDDVIKRDIALMAKKAA